MLVLLSPAKRLNTERLPLTDVFSLPALLPESARLMKTTRNLSQRAIAELMHISPDLAKLNAGRYKELTTDLSPQNARHAVTTFSGDAYLGLDIGSFAEDDLLWAQDHLAILSGLYGLLRPLDLIQPHRLEMGTRLKTRRGRSLYDFWGDRINKLLAERMAALGTDVIVNLASKEYFKGLGPKALDARVITPTFLETKGGESRVLSMFAKQARGMMTRYILLNRIAEPEQLKDFDAAGYGFRPGLSDGDELVFERQQPPPKR